MSSNGLQPIAKGLFIAQYIVYLEKWGKLASEEVITELLKKKVYTCLALRPRMLLLTIADVKSLDFTIIRFLIQET